MMFCQIKEKCHKLFDTVAPEIYNRVLNTLTERKMAEKIRGGAMIGLSGGADSVFLLCFLLEYKKREKKSFPIVACHVNHMIRGDEAVRDEEFSQKLSEALGVDFVSVRRDVPAYAKKNGCGLEEAARDVRYSVFRELLSSREDISSIALAHNASDNLETVIFNMMRGSGLNGMCGILPVRDNVVRPLIRIAKGDIVKALLDAEIPYVTDSTNASVDYTRNYIRHSIVPLLSKLNSSPEAAVSKLTSALLEDNEYLNTLAENEVKALHEPITSSALSRIDKPVLARVLTLLCKSKTGFTLESKHISTIIDNLNTDAFSLSVGGGYSFVCQRGICKFLSSEEQTKNVEVYFLNYGENKIDKYSSLVTVFSENEDILSNVYNFSIQASIPSDIINGSLTLRFRRDGDFILLRGHKRKLKKLFNGMDIPPFMRDRIPVICDGGGILWLPGVGVRDYADCEKNAQKTKITIYYNRAEGRDAFAVPSRPKLNKKD